MGLLKFLEKFIQNRVGEQGNRRYFIKMQIGNILLIIGFPLLVLGIQKPLEGV